MEVDKQTLERKQQEIKDLQVQLNLHEETYALLLNADEPFETLKEIRLKIKYLKVELKAREDHLLAYYKC